MSQTDDFDVSEDYDAPAPDGTDSGDEVEDLRRRLAAAEARAADESDAADAAPAQATRVRGKKAKRAGSRIPDHAPRPQDRQPKKLPQQAEAEDAEIVITAFGAEYRVRRSALQDDWRFFAASASGNLPGMLHAILGQRQFAAFCGAAAEAGMKPMTAAVELMNTIGAELGVGDSGNS